MKPTEQRLYDLERRVETLEKELKLQRKNQTNHQRIIAPSYHREKYPKQDIIKQENQRFEYKEEPKRESKYKLKEALVGKYVVGALASLLVFIGAISLVVLLWDAITPQLKLTMLVLASVLVTAIGYKRILKEKNHINSIILGTGAGLLFISIISSYMYFGYISSNLAFLLAGLWAVLFILAYKYTQTYFTTVIAYIGSYIATILGLSLVIVDMQLNIILAFVTSIALALLVSGYKWLSKKQQLINIILSMSSYLTVMVWVWSRSIFISDTTENLAYLVLLTMIIYLIKNIGNILIDRLEKPGTENKEMQLSYLPIIMSLVTGILVGACLMSALETRGKNIFIAISLLQILFAEWKLKNIGKQITIANIGFIAIVSTIYARTVLISLLGLLLLIILLIGIDTIKRSNNYEEVKIILVIFAMKEILAAKNLGEVNLALYSLILLGIILSLVKMLYDKYRSRDEKYIVSTKVIFYLLLIESVTSLVGEYIYRRNYLLALGQKGMDTSTILYFLISIILVLATQVGYFKNWFNPDFKWKMMGNKDIEEDKSYIIFYISTFLMYIIGLFNIAFGLEGYNIVLMIISTLAVMGVQTIELLRKREKTELIGVWEGLKYLIYIWVVMTSLLKIDMGSVTTSIAGLVVALVSISLGFKNKMKGLRLYGLAVTLLMVFKVITTDMGGQNSINRVISLIVGGIICFIISVVYNKIDKSIED